MVGVMSLLVMVAAVGAGELPRRGNMPLEKIEGVEVRYGEVMTAKGYRVRTYTSRPSGATGRLPLVVFIPWLSCDAVENHGNVQNDGWARMLRMVMRESGAQVVRIEKPGVGDSEGPDCSKTDLDDDLAAMRAGIRAALADPGADPQRLILFGGSIGASLVPVLAREFKHRAIVATGGFARTWAEHMVDVERRRLTLTGKKPAEVNAAMKMFVPFYGEVLDGRTPAQSLAAHPEWKPFWYDEPEHQYGRHIRYYQQVQRLDVEAAWSEVSVPTLLLWGEYDWIMGREEPDRAAAILRARDPSLVTYELRRGMNHHFFTFPNPQAAFTGRGGVFDEGAANLIATWIRNRS